MLAWSLTGGVILNLATAIAALLANPQRAVNRGFFLFAIHLALWTGAALFMVTAADSVELTFWIKLLCAVGVFLPFTFTVLYRSVGAASDRLREAIAASWVPGGLSLVLAGAIFLPGFVSVEMFHSLAGTIRAQVSFGFPAGIILGYIILAATLGAYGLLREIRRARGVQLAELQYVAAAATAAALVAAAILLRRPLIEPQTLAELPLSTIALNLIVAYGIATRNIMNVAQLIRRLFSYGLLLLSLVAVYAAVYLLLAWLQIRSGTQADWLPSMVAAVVVALSIAPAHGILRRLAHRLLVSPQEMNIARSLEQASQVLSTVSTVDRLLSRFGNLVREAFEVEYVALLYRQGKEFVQVYPPAPQDNQPFIRLPADDLLIRTLEDTGSIISRPALLRRRAGSATNALLSKMTVLKAELAGAISAGGELRGLILLGMRKARSVFTNVEQQALQLWLGQLGIALHNAYLYTEVQNSKVYNEILLEHLPAGVIATDSKGTIRVCNREACRILGTESREVTELDVSVLPQPLQSLLRELLQSGRSFRDEEACLAHGDTEIPLRVAGTVVRDNAGESLGAILIFTDQSRVKKLEEQVRRSDRLASVGTLSAGMAHEIKNPLVAIKTFAQLLPERYHEPDFRQTFSELLQKEVQRIDDIVTQLLNLARPRKAALELCHLHKVLEQALCLLQQQIQQKNITLECRLAATRDLVRGDPALLEQTFLNLLINSLEAMDHQGRLCVFTDVYQGGSYSGRTGLGRQRTYIRVHVADTGRGIAPEQLNRIFDPFFTTKEQGTGLGLSVAHEIIEEHDGIIDVVSQPGQGTTFTVSLPLAEEAAAEGGRKQ